MLAVLEEHTMIDYLNSIGNSIDHGGSSSLKVSLFLRKNLQTFTLLLFMGGSSWVAAQQLVDISSCTRITDDKARFACYDNLARAAGAMPPASQPVTATAPVATAATTPLAPAKTSAAPVAASTDASRIAAFGSASKASIETGKGGEEMLVDTVTAVKNYKQDILQITLSSGQVWRQEIAQRFLLLEGDKIHIVPNPFGSSYRLSVDGRSGFIQVEKLPQK